jgi:YcxB-like protein
MADLQGPAATASADGPRFELRFRLQAKDFQALQRRVRWTAIERLVTFLSAAGVGAVGAIAGSLIWLTFEDVMPDVAELDGQLVMIIAGAALLFCLQRFVLAPAYLRSYFTGQPIGMGDTVVIADAAGVKTSSAGIDSGTTWPHIVAVTDTADHLILMFARLGGFVIPKRACESAEHASRLVQFARAMAPAAPK